MNTKIITVRIAVNTDTFDGGEIEDLKEGLWETIMSAYGSEDGLEPLYVRELVPSPEDIDVLEERLDNDEEFGYWMGK